MPFNAKPDIQYPAVYLLDGNQYFATEVLTRLSYFRNAESAAPAIIIGIGYPTDDPGEVIRRRAFDLTPSLSRVSVPGISSSGGGDAFLREVLADEETFAKRARAGEFRLRVLITSASDEQYRGNDPKLLEADRRMVDAACKTIVRNQNTQTT